MSRQTSIPLESVIVTDVKYDDLLALWTLWTYTIEAHDRTGWTIILANIVNADRAMTLVEETWDKFIGGSNKDHVLNIYRGDAGAMWGDKIYEQRHEKPMFGTYKRSNLQDLSLEHLPLCIHRYLVMAPFRGSASIVPRLAPYKGMPAIKATGIGYNTTLESLDASLAYLNELHALMPAGSCDFVFNNNTTWRRIPNKVVGTLPATHLLNIVLPQKLLKAALEDSSVFRKDQVDKIASALRPLGVKMPPVEHLEDIGLEGDHARRDLMSFLTKVKSYVDGENPWVIATPFTGLAERVRKQFGHLTKIMDAYSDPNFGDIRYMTVEVTDCLQMALLVLKDIPKARRAVLGISDTGRFITLDPLSTYPDDAYYIYTDIDMLSIADVLAKKLVR